MNKLYIYSLQVLLIAALVSCKGRQEGAIAHYDVIPLPQQMEQSHGEPFVLNASTRIGYPKGNEKIKQTASFLAQYIREITGYEPEVVPRYLESNGINLTLGDTATFSPEGYQLSIREHAIHIAGSSEAGVFYGIQTLRKSLPTATTGDIVLPEVTIRDYPRFTYRGMHLDVGRHFFSPEFVKQYIDILALHNLNTFHWHLTEDQGWRIEIKKYPRLTEIGSLRKESLLNDGSGQLDGTPYGGFYTQQEVRDIVKYAAARYITIIPEIDLPGHSTALLAAYPELGCTGGPYEVATTYGVHKEVLCVSNEQALTFVENVLSEVIDLFPSSYIHVGGDECPRDRWEKCPKCQALIRKNGWIATDQHKAEDKLQSYFMTRIEEFVNQKGRRIIGWDEILEGGLAPNATVMSWRGMEGGIQAARQRHNVVMTPAGTLYFNNKQLLELGGNRGIKRMYDFEPVPDTLSEEVQKYIIGAQGCLWSERVDTPERAEYLLLPRLAALSEVAWTLPEKKNFDDFLNRLYSLVRVYDKAHYNYSRHAFRVTEAYTPDTVKQALTVSFSTLGNRPIYYTIDGSLPDTASIRYSGPFLVTKDTDVKAAVIQAGDTSEIFSETIRVNKTSFKPCRLMHPPHKSYTFGGASTLTDGLQGDTNYNTGRWLGFLGTDMDLVIDMQQPTAVSSVALTTDVSKGAAVMGAAGLEVWVSDNGTDFRKVASQSIPILQQTDRDGIYPHTLSFNETTVRYLRIIARVTPQLPAWHSQAGTPAFLFVDEVSAQ